MNDTLSPEQLSKRFVHCTDSRGRQLRGIWKRGNRFYASMLVPGKGQRYVPLLDEKQDPVDTVQEAQKAYHRVQVERDLGRTPGPRIAPHFSDYYLHYLEWCETTAAKGLHSIDCERAHLKGWAKFLGELRINLIRSKHLKEYALQRTKDGISTRTVNLGVIALSNMLNFAKDEGWLKHELVTEKWKPLKYVAPRKQLLTWDQIQAICDKALETTEKDGKCTLRFENGQFLSDYIKLLSFSGTRKQAALSLRWEQVDWNLKQVTFHTKFDRYVTVDFNPKLEDHLKDMWSRRNVALEARFRHYSETELCQDVTPEALDEFLKVRDKQNPWVFPSPKVKGAYFANPQKLLEEVAQAAGVPDFNLHRLRHFFISYAVMSGVDTLTIASFVGHSDGGKLIGSTYGHLNPQHKRNSAAKITFSLPEITGEKIAPKPPMFDLSALTAEQLLAALQQKMAEK